jgi:hypothetical protein
VQQKFSMSWFRRAVLHYAGSCRVVCVFGWRISTLSGDWAYPMNLVTVNVKIDSSLVDYKIVSFKVLLD